MPCILFLSDRNFYMVYNEKIRKRETMDKIKIVLLTLVSGTSGYLLGKKITEIQFDATNNIMLAVATLENELWSWLPEALTTMDQDEFLEVFMEKASFIEIARTEAAQRLSD